MTKKREYDVVYVVREESKHRGNCLFSGCYIFLSVATLGTLPLLVWSLKIVGRVTREMLHVLGRGMSGLGKVMVKGTKLTKQLATALWRALSEYRVTLDGRFVVLGVVALTSFWFVANRPLLENALPGETQEGSWMVMDTIFLLLSLMLVVWLGYWVYSEYRKLEEVSKENELLRSNAEHYFIREWLTSPPKNFRNEIEVEIKFVYPLLKFLGFEDNNLSVREWVQVRVGRQVVKGEADWVVRSKGKPFLVVEAKDQSVDLTEEVSAQAQSYAFALKAPYYMVTNGKALKLYRRGIENDELVVSCNVEELADCWSLLRAQLMR